MADNCFVLFNSLLNVSNIKVDSDISLSYEDAIFKKDYMYSTTVLFQNFKNMIDAKYFDPKSVEANATFIFYRKTPHQSYYNYMCTLTNSDFSFSDFNIVNNEFYHYLAAIEVPSSTGTRYVIYENKEDNGKLQYIKDKWESWSICNIKESTEDNIYLQTGYVWKFRCGIENEDITQNLGVTTWDTLGKYSKVSKGVKNFASGSLSCLLGDMKEYTLYNSEDSIEKNQYYQYTEKYNTNNWYARESEKFNKWNDFCNDGNLKLLKDKKGNAWIIQIIDNPTASINSISNIEQTTITFSWQEVEDINSTSIIAIKEIK